MQIFSAKPKNIARTILLIVAVWIVAVLGNIFFFGPFAADRIIHRKEKTAGPQSPKLSKTEISLASAAAIGVSTGVANSTATILSLILVIVGIGQEADRRIKEETAHREELSKIEMRRKGDLIRQHWFQLLLLLPSAVPQECALEFRKKCTKNNGGSLLSEMAKIQEFARWSDAPKDNEKFLKDAARLFKDLVPQSDRFRRVDLFGAFETLRHEADRDQIPFLDQALRSSLSDEQRRLIIMQAVIETNCSLLTFFEEIKILIEGVLNDVPLFNKELISRFRKGEIANENDAP